MGAAVSSLPDTRNGWCSLGPRRCLSGRGHCGQFPGAHCEGADGEGYPHDSAQGGSPGGVHGRRGVQPVPGWDYEFEEEGGVIRAITWSGEEIEPREFQEFAVQARTLADTGGYSWSAFQTYEDGSVVEWTGPPEEAEQPEEDAEEAEEHAMEKTEEGPASVVEVIQGDAQTDRPGAGAPRSGGGFTPIAAYGGLGLGALALVVALLALLFARKAS